MSELSELDFLIEHRQRVAAFHAAKDAAVAAPSDEAAQAAWREQKDSLREWRRFWREVRVGSTPADGEARPDVVGLKAKVN